MPDLNIRNSTQARDPKTLDIVVVGASRGGLDALCKLVGALPARLPAAVLIVLHTGADSPMLLADILARCTPLPVAYARAGETVLHGQVYLASPGHHLVVVSPGRIAFESGPKVRHTRPAADRLFQSAASVYGSRVIGIVLTGGDGDGTDGLRAVKAAGGLSIVQQPSEAVDPSMPDSAIADDFPDYCLPLAEMGPLLMGLVGDGLARPDRDHSSSQVEPSARRVLSA